MTNALEGEEFKTDYWEENFPLNENYEISYLEKERYDWFLNIYGLPG